MIAELDSVIIFSTRLAVDLAVITSGIAFLNIKCPFTNTNYQARLRTLAFRFYPLLHFPSLDQQVSLPSHSLNLPSGTQCTQS